MASNPLLPRQSGSTTSLRNYSSIQRTPVRYSTPNQQQSLPKPAYESPPNSSNKLPYNSNNKTKTNSNHSHGPHHQHHRRRHNNETIKDKHHSKLGTLNGVTLPTILNVLSILMFLRFGFIIGQMGVLGTIFLLLISYGIDLLTTLSISAIATNGTVKGGGAYYMLSRSLGVEFGGAIGVIFYIGQILNSSMNVAGVIEPILFNFNENDGALMKLLPTSYWWQFTYCSLFLFFCIIVALTGASTVSKAGTYLCIILILSTLSVPISAIFVAPFESEYGIYYTGLSWETLKENLLPNFTKGAAGSQLKGVETFNDLFGIFFPATAGILAGASMSGDLKNPSKSIPKGTLNGLLITFSSYFIVILSMGSSIPRNLLYKDTQVLQTINLSPFIVLAGEMSTSIFSIIVGIVGAAKLLQAIARDEILPGLKIFGNGDKKSDDPKEAIILTWIICQLFLFSDLNQIATFITMAFLMTFIVTNMSCALLKIGSAPNFRPSFKYFSTKSALSGTILCLIAMFVVDGISASIIFATLIVLLLLIHFVSPPKSWGDVSQSLIYHQVRKYLLKLRQDNVKYWRPQILLLIDNPRTGWKLISFCNNLKKGGLYVLGHVILVNKFQENINDIMKDKEDWNKIRDISKIKAFVQVSISPIFSWGVRNIFLGCGLGGMKPNITIVGFYDLSKYKGEYKIPKDINFESLSEEFQNQVKIEINELPTDSSNNNNIKELDDNKYNVKITEWIEVLEDLSLLNSNIAVAKGFPRLNLPNEDNLEYKDKKYIDLYPIQMAQRVDSTDEGILTTNFDTCTLILQMGAILHTVPSWKKTHILRVVVFVEEEKDVKEEEKRVKKLLEIIRLQDAEILIICLETSKLGIYKYLSKGDDSIISKEVKKRVHKLLEDDEWWNEICKIRGINDNYNNHNNIIRRNSVYYNNNTGNGNGNGNSLTIPILKNGDNNKIHTRRMTMSKMNQLGLSVGMMSFQTNKFSSKDINNVFGRDNNEDSDLESIRSENSYSSYLNSNTSNGYSEESEGSSIKSINNFNNTNINININNNRPNFQRIKSGNSLRKMKKSAFTADRIPDSTINEDAEGNEASIMFYDNVIELNNKDKSRDKSRDKERNKDKDEKKRINYIKNEIAGGNDESQGIRREVKDKDKEIGDKAKAKAKSKRKAKSETGAKTNGNYLRKGEKSASGIKYSDTGSNSCYSGDKVYEFGDGEGEWGGNDDVCNSEGEGEGEGEEDCVDSDEDSCRLYEGEEFSRGDGVSKVSFDVKFDSMTRRCQFMILNEMMQMNSSCNANGNGNGKGELVTDLIMSTLPVPDVGLHLTEVECVDYTVDLALWMEQLPAILLLNAKTVTVTSNL